MEKIKRIGERCIWALDWWLRLDGTYGTIGFLFGWKPMAFLVGAIGGLWTAAAQLPLSLAGGFIVVVAGGLFVLVLITLVRWIFGIKGPLPIHIHHGELTAQAGVVPSLSMEVIRAPLPPIVHKPDWSIRQLFFHIRPEFRNPKQRGSEIDEVGRMVVDKFSTGLLKAWGREISNQRGRLPLAGIPESYWTKGFNRLTYYFLDKPQDDPYHTKGNPDYAEIQVSRAQALQIWPATVDSADIGLQEAIWFVIHGRWLRDDEQAMTEIAHMTKGDAVASDMRRRAHDGDFTIWGKNQPTSLHERIPKEFWKEHKIDTGRLFTSGEARTEPAGITPSRITYGDLMVNRHQTEQLWQP